MKRQPPGSVSDGVKMSSASGGARPGDGPPQHNGVRPTPLHGDGRRGRGAAASGGEEEVRVAGSRAQGRRSMKTATLLALPTTPASWLQARRSAKTPSRRRAAWGAGGAWDSGLRRGLHLRPRTRWTPGKIGSRVAMASILGSVRAGVGHPPAGRRHRGASRRSERALQRRR
jgi:hypothetical protein